VARLTKSAVDPLLPDLEEFLPYLELGGYAFGMAPILNGWKYEVLEKIYWPAGK